MWGFVLFSVFWGLPLRIGWLDMLLNSVFHGFPSLLRLLETSSMNKTLLSLHELNDYFVPGIGETGVRFGFLGAPSSRSEAGVSCGLAGWVLDSLRWSGGGEEKAAETGFGQLCLRRCSSFLGEVCAKHTEMAQSEKWAQNGSAQHSAVMEIRCGGSRVTCVFMCVCCEQQDGGRAASEKSSFPSIIWKHSLFPDCWLCLFSATQTLLGNGFSCQRSVINTCNWLWA